MRLQVAAEAMAMIIEMCIRDRSNTAQKEPLPFSIISFCEVGFSIVINGNQWRETAYFIITWRQAWGWQSTKKFYFVLKGQCVVYRNKSLINKGFKY